MLLQVDGSKKKRPLVLIRVPKDHDLVLEFDSVGERRKFINKFEAFLNSHKKHLVTLQAPRDFLLAQAETRERRQKRLEHFFREAYALTFGLRPGERHRGDEDGEVSVGDVRLCRSVVGRLSLWHLLWIGCWPRDFSIPIDRSKRKYNCLDNEKNQTTVKRTE